MVPWYVPRPVRRDPATETAAEVPCAVLSQGDPEGTTEALKSNGRRNCLRKKLRHRTIAEKDAS